MTIGEKSVVPSSVKVGKNTVIFGITEAADYAGGILDSGKTLIKNGGAAV